MAVDIKSTAQASSDRYAILIILLVVFMGFVGVSMPYPIFPPMFLHPEYNSIIPEAWHSSARSLFLGITLALYPLGQFIGSPILGAYSDRYGRKRILLWSIDGTAFGYFLSACALHFQWLGLLLLSRLITGLMEGNISIARSMVVDLKHINKHKGFGWINGATALGYVIGPIVGGLLSDHQLVSWFSLSLPFYLAGIISTLALILSALKLTETRQVKDVTHESIIAQFNIIHRLKKLFQNKSLQYLFTAGAVFYLGIDLYYEFGPVYLTTRWLMSPAQISVYNTLLSATLSFSNAWLAYRLAQILSASTMIKLGIVASAVILALMIVIPSKSFVLILFALSGIAIPMVVIRLTVQISDVASEDIQGEVLGTQWGLRMLGDAVICFVSGALILWSIYLPLTISAITIFLAGVIYSIYASKIS